MTTRTEAGAEKSFVSALLPWMAAALVAVVYLLTLNHWLSFRNLQSVAVATGQTLTPQVYFPLFTLVTSPFRWLPETWIPLALNLFAMACAFLVLALLARSVALLPHDRTHKQREREQSRFGLLSLSTSWIPPVLAVLVCGLQLTFWENATTLTSGMFDLLLFAYAVRCMLEYRINKQESWLLRAAVVYAAGTTDTWVMLGLFPIFLAAIIWIRGLGFFQLRFLARLFLCILAGFLLYLYLPFLHLRSDGYFWVPLKGNVGYQLSQIVTIWKYTPHHVQFLLVLTSLLPLLVIGIRWKSYFGDTSELGIALTTWIFHLTHAALLGVCIWAAFDTGFGLRDPASRFPVLSGDRDRFLPLCYLSALSIGYLSGYFLVVFKPLPRRGRRVSTPQKLLNGISVTVICVLLALTPIGLLYKNVPDIKVTNGPALKNYASFLTEHFPSGGVILSDDPVALLISQQWLERNGKARNFAFLETHMLKLPSYYRFQARKHPDILPEISTNLISDTATFNDMESLRLIANLAEKHPVYYLQPSFGYYFEAFYPVPHGMTYELKRYPTNTITFPPPLSEAVFSENETFWKQHNAEIRALMPAITVPTTDQDSDLRQRWMKKMHIPLEQNFTAFELGLIYSRALNTWGVEAQRTGRLEIAGNHFETAVALFPDNVVAKANAEFNKKLRNGERVAVDDPGEFENRFGKFKNWTQTLNANGTFDEPTGCLAEGIVFARGKLDRQAAQYFERTLALAPESVLARLWLARVYLVLGMSDKVYPLIDELKARSDSFVDAAINPSDVFQVELATDYISQKPDRVQRLLTTTMSRTPPDTTRLAVAARISVFYKDYANALLLVEKQLGQNPGDSTLLLNKGFIQVQMTNSSEAISSFSKVLSLQPTNSTALYGRALSYLQSEQLDEARRDYETLEKIFPRAYPVYHGLAEVAFRKKDTNIAIHYYELDLTNVPPNSAEAKFVLGRLKSLKTGSP